jgi:hypothetical protein
MPPTRSAPCASPLVGILEDGFQNRTMLKHPREPVYCSFAKYGELASSQCKFEPMNSNRVVNEDVVDKRVRANRAHFRELGHYQDFGEIAVLVLRDDPSNTFHIMDGQHRCRAMQVLHEAHPQRELSFQFRVRVVANEREAHEALLHFQDQYPADPRSFLRTQKHTRLATSVVEKLHDSYRGAFRNAEVKLSSRQGGGHTPDPSRPFLNDYLLFWLLDKSGLLDEAGATPKTILERLLSMNSLLASKQLLGELGPNVTEHMRAEASRTCGGCFLGFFRDGKLHWERYARELPDPPPPEGDGSVSGGSSRRGRKCEADAGDPEHLCCPVTFELLEEPVVARCCGRTFSKAALEDCIRQRSTCPLCRSRLDASMLTRNLLAANLVQEYQQKRQQPAVLQQGATSSAGGKRAKA